MKKVILAIGIGFGLLSCENQEKKAYQPEGLTKLTHKEILERLDKSIGFNPAELTFKSTDGVVLSEDSIKTLFREGKTFGDQYINKEGKVVEMILRPMTEEDKKIIGKIRHNR